MVLNFESVYDKTFKVSGSCNHNGSYAFHLPTSQMMSFLCTYQSILNFIIIGLFIHLTYPAEKFTGKSCAV